MVTPTTTQVETMHPMVSYPQCGHEGVTPVPAFDEAQATRRTLPVITTVQNGSFSWLMIVIVVAMWPPPTSVNGATYAGPDTSDIRIVQKPLDKQKSMLQ